MTKTRIRVAIVDDDASVRKALTRLLNIAAFEAISCSSGAELMGCLESFKPHCIILDLHMPALGGIEILRQLSQKGSRSAIIIITGHDSPKMHQECIALGAKFYFAKPIDGDELIAAVRKSTAETTA